MNLFQVPQPSLGLMGRTRAQGRNRMPLIPGMELEGLLPPPADPIDEAMIMAARQREEAAAARRAQDEAVLSTRPRERVSGMRLLDRVLGGQTITEGLDAERERLTAEANRGGSVERQRQILSQIQDPYERAIYLADPAKWSENAGTRLRPVTTAEGSITSYGMGPNATRVAPPVIERFEDRFGIIDPLNPGAGTQYTAPRGPTYAEETGRINATNPVSVAQNATLVDPATGATVAQGMTRPDYVNVAPGGTSVGYGPNGEVISQYQSPVARATSPAVLKRADDLELQLTQDQNAIGRVQGLLGRIENGEIDINPMANLSANVRNAIGASSPNSLGIAEVRTTVEALRNSILQDANGVQTEGDAVRALNAILAGINDPKVVAQGFREYLRAKNNVARTRQQQLERLRGGSEAAPASSGGSRPRAQNPQTGEIVELVDGAWVPVT